MHGSFVPNKVLAFIDPSAGNRALLEKEVPLLAGKGLVDGEAAAYVCKDFTCRTPVTAPEALAAALSKE